MRRVESFFIPEKNYRYFINYEYQTTDDIGLIQDNIEILQPKNISLNYYSSTKSHCILIILLHQIINNIKNLDIKSSKQLLFWIKLEKILMTNNRISVKITWNTLIQYNIHFFIFSVNHRYLGWNMKRISISTRVIRPNLSSGNSAFHLIFEYLVTNDRIFSNAF